MKREIGLGVAVVLGVAGGLLLAGGGDIVDMSGSVTRNFPIDVPTGSDEVAFQIGGFDVGCNVDQGVWGPSIVVYGDGATIASSDGPTGFESMALELPAMVRITSAALHLPEDPELGTPQWETDATPFVVAVGDHLWDVWEEDDAVERFVATVRSEVAAADGQPWQPERWFVSGGSGPQVAAERGDAWSATPVFPHQLDRYPTIGTVRCFRDSATDSR